MKFIDPYKDRWHPLGGEDGPPVSITPDPYLLLDLAQWHAVRAQWPAGVPVGAEARQRRRHRGRRGRPDALRTRRAALPEVGRRPRLQPGAPAALALPLRRRNARDRRGAGRHDAAARAHRLRCRRAARRPVDRRGRTRARLLRRPLPGRRARQPAVVRATAGHGRSAGPPGRRVRRTQGLRYERDRTLRTRHRRLRQPCRARGRGAAERPRRSMPAASCRRPAWAPKTWSSPT